MSRIFISFLSIILFFIITDKNIKHKKKSTIKELTAPSSYISLHFHFCYLRIVGEVLEGSPQDIFKTDSGDGVINNEIEILIP